MEKQRGYKQIPLISYEMRCPICNKKITGYTTRKVALYRKEHVYAFERQLALPFCTHCKISFLSGNEYVRRERGKAYYVAYFKIVPGMSVTSVLEKIYSEPYSSSFVSAVNNTENDKIVSLKINDKEEMQKKQYKSSLAYLYEHGVQKGSTASINRLAQKKRFYFVSNKMLNCLCCGHSLMEYVNFIPISEKEIIKMVLV